MQVLTGCVEDRQEGKDRVFAPHAGQAEEKPCESVSVLGLSQLHTL